VSSVVEADRELIPSVPDSVALPVDELVSVTDLVLFFWVGAGVGATVVGT
jgi:hypothetical protein